MVNLNNNHLYKTLLDNYRNTSIIHGKSIGIGLSGGSDSVVLLDLLSQLSQELDLTLVAIHVNHGISANSNYWADFCSKLALKYNISIQIYTHQLQKKGGQSLEDIARIARYKDFAQSDLPIIATAHHRQDQVETILSQILRGNSPTKCTGMQSITAKHNYLQWRPLLNISKYSINEYITSNNVDYINDESNQNNQYLRNMLRNQVIPVINKFDATAEGKILGFADKLRQDYALLDNYILQDYNKCIVHSSQLLIKFPALDIGYFSTLSLGIQTKIIYHHLEQLQLPLPSLHKINEFIHQVLTTNTDKHPECHIADNYYLTRCATYILVYYLPKQMISNNDVHYKLSTRVDNITIKAYNPKVKLANGETLKEFYALHPVPNKLKKMIPLYYDQSKYFVPSIIYNPK